MKDIAKIRKDMETDAKKLSSSAFMDNAPPDIVEKVKEKVRAMSLKLEKLDKNLKFLEAIND